MIKFIKQQYIFLFCLLIALLFTSNLATWAYDPAIGSGAGAVQSQLEQQLINDAIEKEFIQKDFTPKKKKEGFSEKLKKTSPDAKRQDLEYDPNFILNKVIFEGNTIYKDQELQSIALDLIGEEIQIDDMINLVEIVTRKYHYDGYITSYAFLPEQDVVNGVVTIKIIESKVSEINIDGNRWNRDWYFKSDMFYPSRLKQGSVFNVAKVDSVIKIMNDKPDIKGNIYVSKNAKENTEINLDVKDRFPIKFNVAYDDHGRESVGLQRARMLLSNDNLTGFGDKIYGGVVLASRTTGVVG